MWRDSIEGSRDLWIAMRTKGTREFLAATKQGAGTWKLNACPMDGGRIVALGHGRFASVWQRAGEIFYAPGDGTEIHLGPGKQPVALVRNGETLVFWQQGADLVSTQAPAGINPAKYAAARVPRTGADRRRSFAPRLRTGPGQRRHHGDCEAALIRRGNDR